MRGLKLMFLVGLLLFAGVVGGALVAAPFVIVGEALGYKVDEMFWFAIGAVIVTPYFVGQSFPMIRGWLSEN